MDQPAQTLIPADALEAVVRDIFAAAGCDDAEAGRISHHLLGANLAGHDSHGVARVPRYVEWLAAGYVLAGRHAEVVLDGGGFGVIDGGFGFGQTVAPEAVQWGIDRALERGTAVVALRNAGHIGRVGAYAEQALERGLVSVHFVNVAGSTLVAPFGGAERRFSTAPVAVGVPLDGQPVVLDFATSRVAEGKVLVASNGGKPLPPDALIEPDGTLSGDPRTLYGDYDAAGNRGPDGLGAIRAFGEHKGSGLALICELLAGALTGGGTAGPIEKRGRISNGMLSIYVSPDHLGTAGELQAIGRRYVDWVRTARPAVPGQPVQLPGEPEAATRARRLRDGVPLPQGTWTAIQRTAQSLGLTPPGA